MFAHVRLIIAPTNAIEQYRNKSPPVWVAICVRLIIVALAGRENCPYCPKGNITRRKANIAVSIKSRRWLPSGGHFIET